MKIKNYKKHVLLFLFAFTFAIAICGTTTAANVNETISDYNTVITGNVIKCSDSTPFSGVNISVSDNKKVLVSTITDENGYYSVAFNSNKKSFGVTATYPGHESSTETVKVVTNNSGQKTSKADFQLGPQKATVVDLKSGYYKEIYFEDYYDDSSSAGTISVTINGVSYDAYCIDLFTDIYPDDVLLVNGALVANGTGNLPSGVDWSKVNYIVHTYSADGVINGSKDKAINGAAIQSAIWYFTTAQYGKYSNKNKVKYQFMTDPMDNNYDAKLTSGSNKAAVRNLAQYIINQANTVTFYYPVLITINPQSATLHNGDTQTITATVYDQNNNPLQGVNVSFSTDRGSLSSASGTTNTQGQVTVNLTTGGLNRGIANVLAWVTGNYGTLLYYDPTGTKLQDLTTTTTVPYSIQAASTITFAKKADVTITKTTSNPTPNVGQQFNYTITLTNNGPDPATNINVTDNIPEGLTFINYNASQGSYNNGVWTVGTLDLTKTATLNIYVTPTTDAAGKDITNTATETQIEYDPTPATASATAHVKKADVSMTKTTNNSTPNVGQQFYYTITLNNNGPDDASNVQVTDTIPEWLTFNYYTSSIPNSYNNGVWTVGTLENGSTATLNLFVTPTNTIAGETLTNTATETQTEYDPTPATASVNIHVPKADMTMTKTASNPTPNVGQEFYYTITITNNGPDTSTDIQVYDRIPQEYFTLNNYTSSQGTYSNGIWTVGTLDNTKTATLTLYVTPKIAAAGQTITNTATETQTEYDPTPATASATIHDPIADVTMTKTASNKTPNVGEEFYYTITLTNNGPDDATNIKVIDNIPINNFTLNNYEASQGSYNNGIWTIDSLEKGKIATLKLYVTPTMAIAGQTIINTATETQTEYDPTPATASATIEIPNTANLTQSGFYVPYCQTIYWCISLKNTTNQSITNIKVYAINSENETKFYKYYVNYGSGWIQDNSYNKNTEIWTINELPAGAEYLLALYVTPEDGTSKTYTNTAIYNYQEAASSLYVPTWVIGLDQTAEYQNNQITWTISVTNSGEDAADFYVWDKMGNESPNTEYVDYQISYDNGTTWVQDGTYDPTNGKWNINNLQTGKTYIIKIIAKPLNGSGKYTNTATTTTNQKTTANIHVP